MRAPAAKTQQLTRGLQAHGQGDDEDRAFDVHGYSAVEDGRCLEVAGGTGS